MFLHISFVSRIWHHISSPGSLCLWWTAFPSTLSVGLTTPEGVLPYISYTGMCKQYKDDRDEDSLLDLYEVEFGEVLDVSSLLQMFVRAYCGTDLAKVRRFMQGISSLQSRRGHFSSLARFARRTKKKGRLLVNYEARRPLPKKPRDYDLDTGCCIVLIFFLIWPCQGLLLT